MLSLRLSLLVSPCPCTSSEHELLLSLRIPTKTSRSLAHAIDQPRGRPQPVLHGRATNEKDRERERESSPHATQAKMSGRAARRRPGERADLLRVDVLVRLALGDGVRGP